MGWESDCEEKGEKREDFICCIYVVWVGDLSNYNIPFQIMYVSDLIINISVCVHQGNMKAELFVV